MSQENVEIVRRGNAAFNAGDYGGFAETLHPDVEFRDLYDHVLRVYDELDTQRDLLTGILEAHLSVVSNRLNEVVLKLSSWAGIVLVPTLIAGIYGMNFREMPELHWQFGYLYALGLMALSGAVLWWRFRRAGWL